MQNRKYIDGEFQIAYREYGGEGGPVILILHGLFGMADNWHTIASHLVKQAKAEGRELRVFVLDLLNHGFSGWVETLSYKTLARAVAFFIQELELPQSIILGHSMGGKTAMLFAADFPELVSGLIIVDIAPKAYPDSHSHIIQALRELPVNRLDSRQAVDDALSRSLPQPVLRSFLLKNLKTEEEGFSWLLNIEGIARGYEELRGWQYVDISYNGPVRVIAGAESNYINIGGGDVEILQEFSPKVEIQVIEGAGHWVHAEKREEFLQVLTHILRDFHIL